MFNRTTGEDVMVDAYSVSIIVAPGFNTNDSVTDINFLKIHILRISICLLNQPGVKTISCTEILFKL